MILRQMTVNFVKQNQETFKEYFELNEDIKKWAIEMSKDGVWGGNVELYAIAMMLNIKIEIYYDEELSNPGVTIVPPNWVVGNEIIMMNYINHNHYNALVWSDANLGQLEQNLPLEVQAKQNVAQKLSKEQIKKIRDDLFHAQGWDRYLQKKICKEQKSLGSIPGLSENLENGKKNSNPLPLEKKENIFAKEDKNNNDNSKEEAPTNVFPQNLQKKPLCCGKQYIETDPLMYSYNEIAFYMEKQEENTDNPHKPGDPAKVIYPSRIYNIKSAKEREKEKEKLREKSKKFKFISCPVCGKKRLAIMWNVNKSSQEKSKPCDLMIPFEGQKQEIIKMAHGDINHLSWRRTELEIQDGLCYYWYGMTTDVKKYVENCDTCVQGMPNRKRKPCGQIIPAYPRERYQMDLLELHEKIYEKSQKEARYLLNIIDHFSKYA